MTFAKEPIGWKSKAKVWYFFYFFLLNGLTFVTMGVDADTITCNTSDLTGPNDLERYGPIGFTNSTTAYDGGCGFSNIERLFSNQTSLSVGFDGFSIFVAWNHSVMTGDQYVLLGYYDEDEKNVEYEIFCQHAEGFPGISDCEFFRYDETGFSFTQVLATSVGVGPHRLWLSVTPCSDDIIPVETVTWRFDDETPGSTGPTACIFDFSGFGNPIFSIMHVYNEHVTPFQVYDARIFVPDESQMILDGLSDATVNPLCSTERNCWKFETVTISGGTGIVSIVTDAAAILKMFFWLGVIIVGFCLCLVGENATSMRTLSFFIFLLSIFIGFWAFGATTVLIFLALSVGLFGMGMSTRERLVK